jgi:hypothetical protein
MDLPAFYESIVLADATMGGITYEAALEMTTNERRAALQIIKERREKEKNTANTN